MTPNQMLPITSAVCKTNRECCSTLLVQGKEKDLVQFDPKSYKLSFKKPDQAEVTN